MLGFVSLFMDMSSELVHSLLPVFLVSTLGASVMTVGVIEGLAEAAALIAKVFSGTISDYFRRRKGLLLLGYGMAALTKPLFPLATSAETVFVARFLDRIGKGIRGAPRDALVADVAPPAIRGACFGLRQSMDTVGAFLGPSLAILLMFLFASDIRRVLWFAVVPALITVFLIVLGIKDPDDMSARHRFRSPIRLDALKQFSGDYWRVVAIGAIFTLARFSEAFLVLRAQQVGFAIQWLPLVMVVMSLAYTLSAYPAGILSDRVNRRYLLAAGIMLLIVADLVLAWAGSPSIVLVGVALLGAAHGLHPRYPCRHDRRGNAAGIEGDRLWPVQLGKRPVHAFGQSDRGRVMGNVRSGYYVLRRSRLFAIRLGHADFARAVRSDRETCR